MARVALLALTLFAASRPAIGLERVVSARLDAYRPVPLRDGEPFFHIPADSRLARNEHPRFLLVREDLAALKKRLDHPTIAAEFRAVCAQGLEHAASRHTALLKCAIAYKLTGEKKFLATSSQYEFPFLLAEWKVKQIRKTPAEVMGAGEEEK